MAGRDGHVVDLWWADLRSADIRLAALLDAGEAVRLERMRTGGDRGRFLVGAALLRVAVAAATEVSVRSVEVARACTECGEPHGAPRVAGAQVSVAHAGPLVLVATSTVAVGVDVDSLDRGDDVEQWVTDEAVFKAGVTDGVPVTTRRLPAPLPGFLAALALAGEQGRAQEWRVVTHGLQESAAALRTLLSATA